jgi:4-amino-4-deoxy-L-arabinose transferase-like glycosyltransferase
MRASSGSISSTSIFSASLARECPWTITAFLLSYWLLHLAWLFPWSFGIPLLAMEVRSLRSLDRRRLIILYTWLWAGSILIFFSLSTNQEYYTFPAYPPLCLLLGASLASAEERTNWNRYLTWMSGAIAPSRSSRPRFLGLWSGCRGQ